MHDEFYDPAPVFYRTAAGLWLLGFTFALMPFEAYEAESFLLAVICTVFSTLCILAVAPLENLKASLHSPLIILALAFWALALFSVVLSEIPFVSFIYFCFFSVFPLGLFFTLLQGENSAFFKIIAVGLAGVYALLGLSCLIQYFFLPEWLFNGFVNWPLANPNSLGGLLSPGLFGSFGWMLIAKNRVQSNSALILSAVLLAAIFTTGSRGAWLALLPALMIFTLFAPGHIQKHKRCVLIVLSFGILAFLSLGLFAPPEARSPMAMVNQTLEGLQPVLWSRPEIWTSTLTIFKEHMWSGTGIGTFFLYYPEVRSTADTSSAGLMVHSDPLQFAVEMGLFAPMIFYAFIGFAIMRTLRSLKSLAPDDTQRALILAPFCGFAAMAVHAHISFHFHVLPILMVAGPALGFWFVQTGNALGQTYKYAAPEPYKNPVMRWALALPLLALLGIFSSFQASEILTRNAQNALMKGDMNTFAQNINHAGKLSKNQNARALIAATNIPLGILQLNAPFMPPAKIDALYTQITNLLDRAETQNPRLAQIPYHRAEIYSFTHPFLPRKNKDSRENAESYARRALALDPLHLGSRIMLADLTARKGDKQGALNILKTGLAWRYKTQNPRFFLEKTMRFARELEDKETLRKARHEFQVYFPHEHHPNPETP